MRTRHAIASIVVLLSTAGVLGGCFSASTPKDSALLDAVASYSDGVLVLDVQRPMDSDAVSQLTDAAPSETDTTPSDSEKGETSPSNDVHVSDSTPSTDTLVPDDVSILADATVDVDSNDASTEDGAGGDTAEEVSVPEDAATDGSIIADVGDEDIGPSDTTPPCEGVNCPGTQAPTWALEDFQPQSPWFQLTYGLEKFEGKVTVMVLLAGW